MAPELPTDDQGRRLAPVKLNMTGRERRNIVPVDWVSAIISRLMGMPEARGQTFHLAPEEPVTTEEIIEACAACYNTVGHEFCGDDPNFVADEPDPLVPYKAYEQTDNTFDLTNLQTLLPDLPAPRIDHDVIARYISFGERDRWGKSRQKATRPKLDVGEYLQSVSGRDEPLSVVGLDVLGPGGGQWLIRLSDFGVSSAERGLPPWPIPIFRLTVLDFTSIAEGGFAGDWLDVEASDSEDHKEIGASVLRALFPVSSLAEEWSSS